jgi:hypothetical protein
MKCYESLGGGDDGKNGKPLKRIMKSAKCFIQLNLALALKRTNYFYCLFGKTYDLISQFD